MIERITVIGGGSTGHKSNCAACEKRTAIRNQMAVRFLRDIGGMIRWRR